MAIGGGKWVVVGAGTYETVGTGAGTGAGFQFIGAGGQLAGAGAQFMGAKFGGYRWGYVLKNRVLLA